jgi:hypothetical protein
MADMAEPWLRPWGGAVSCDLGNSTWCALGPEPAGLENVGCIYFGSEAGYLCSCEEGRSGPTCEQVSLVSQIWGFLFLAVPLRAANGLRISASAARNLWLSGTRTTRVTFVLACIAHFSLGIGGLVTAASFLGFLGMHSGAYGTGFAWAIVFAVLIAMFSIVADTFYWVVESATQAPQTRARRLLAANALLQAVTLIGMLQPLPAIARPFFAAFRVCECVQVAILIHATARLKATLGAQQSAVGQGSNFAERLESLIERSYRLARQLFAYMLVIAAHVYVIAVDGWLPSDHALPAARYVFDRLVGFAFQLCTTQMVIWIVRYFRAPLVKKTSASHKVVASSSKGPPTVPSSHAVSSVHPAGPRGSIAPTAGPRNAS